MNKLTRFACALVLLAACGKSETKTAPKPVDEPAAPAVAKVEKKVEKKAAPAPAAPKPDQPADLEPDLKADPSTPQPSRATAEMDQTAVLNVDQQTKLAYKTENDDFIDVEVKPRVVNGKQAFDVVANGKVIDTIASDVEKDAFNMEVKAHIGIAPREGVLAVVHSTKTTGKPGDYYLARVYTTKPGSGALEYKRKIQFDQVYDPSQDRAFKDGIN